VTLTDEGTNIAVNNVTNGSGIYRFAGVRPGRYTIRAEASGLAWQQRKALTLAVSQRATLNFNLSPPSAAEVITVM
jgi:protocatechuate 3,4-dioxygenase beta subunit